MRILAVTNMYPSKESPGSGVFVEEQIKSLRRLGLEVRVLFVNRKREGAAVYYRMRTRIEQALAEFQPDLIHVMYGGVMAAQVVQHHRVRPILVTFHGSDLLGENLSGWMRKLVSGYGVWCSKRAARAADGVIVVARHLLRALPRMESEAKVRVLPCGIDLHRFRPLDTLACKRELKWNKDAFHVLFASGNGDPVKRPWLAREAVGQALKRGVAIELHCMTHVPPSEVPIWLNASDALLLTSHHEGSPTIVKEALACELPVVSVPVGDVMERIGSIEGCHLAEPNASALAEKLFLVQLRKDRLDSRGQLEEISAANVARRLKSFYEWLVGAARGKPSFPTANVPEARSRELCDERT
jgi:teichuronic acid biosynthesis glycosyltransferase TuaC